MEIKVVLYIHHAVSQGGAPTSLAYLIKGLDKTKYKPVVLMPKRKGPKVIKKLFEDAGAEVIEERRIYPFGGVNGRPCDTFKDRVKAIGGAFFTYFAIKKHVRKVKPDLVHINTSVQPFAAAAVKHSVTVPVLAHIRETIVSSWWGRLLAALNKRFVDFFIGIDEYGLTRLGIDSERSVVIRNFVDRNKFAPNKELREKYRHSQGWTDEQTIFLSLSRVSEANGAHELLKFLLDHDQEIEPSCKFVFAGFSHENDAYEAKSRSLIELSKRSVALDYESDVVSLINAADVIIAPFTSAHSARSVLEGAAIGKPALVSNLPNLTELIQPGKTGLSFEFQQPDDFIIQINKLSDDKIRAAMKQPAIDLAVEQYDLTTNCNRVQDLYQRFLENP